MLYSKNMLLPKQFAFYAQKKNMKMFTNPHLNDNSTTIIPI